MTIFVSAPSELDSRVSGGWPFQEVAACGGSASPAFSKISRHVMVTFRTSTSAVIVRENFEDALE